MAETKKVTLKRFNGTDQDTIHPKTEWDQIESKPATFTPTAHNLNSHTDVNAVPTAAGQVLTWDADNQVWVASTTAGGGVSKADLQNLYIYGKADVAITKGQAIQFAGAQGDHILMKPAVPSEINANPDYIIGIAETDLAIGDFGYVLVNGRLILDTSTYTAGDILYFASAGSTAGALTTTEPTGGEAIIQMAAVSISGVGNGEFVVRTLLLSREIHEIIGLQDALDAKATPSDITIAIDNLVASAPGALDTLDELAAALGDDANFATTVTNSLASKVSKSGDTMTGNLDLENTTAASLSQITLKQSSNQFFRIHHLNSGFTESGTNIPNSALLTAGNGSTGGMVLRTDASAPIIFATNGTTNERMRITSGGNVGIGTTSPTTKLEVQDGRLRVDGGASAGVLEIANSTKTNYIFTSGSNLYIRTDDANADVILQATGTQGNVGIGTDNPTAKLTVVDSSTRGLEFEEITGGIMRMLAYDRTNTAEVPLELRGDSIDFETNGTRRFLITDSGAAVTGALTVNGTAVSLDGHTHTFASLTSKPTTLSGYGITDAYTQTQVNSQISTAISNLVNTAPTTLDTLNELALALGNDANFSTTVSTNIGTKVSKSGDTMTGTLVVGQVDSGNPSAGTDNIRVSGYGILGNRGSFYVTNQNTSGDIQFGVGGVHAAETKMIVKSSGNVGIGTTSPSEKLDVVGNVAVQGNLLLTGGTTTTNQGRTIDFTGFDKEGVTDFSDRAYIQHTTNTGGHSGSVLVISSQNDSTDGIAFLTNASSLLKHNSNNIFTDAYHPNADKWTTARTLSLTGDVTGSVSWDGSGNASITTAVANDSHTHDGRYYTESEADGRFVNVAGDTMTSNLFFPASSGIIQNQASTSNYTSPIKWYKGGSSQSTYDPQIGQHNTGGTGTGSITILPYPTTTSPWGGSVGLFITESTIAYKGNTMWHAGNDGSGSGLDADTLDGQHASAFAAASHTHSYLPLSGGTLTGTLTTRAIAMQNYDLTGVGSISINDPGPNEGVFFGGNFQVYESPDDLTTNSSGNLQFVSGGARRMTIDTSGNVYANGGSGIFQGSEFRITDSSTRLIEGSGNALRMQTGSGYIDIGSMNSSWAHITTDRARFYFGNPVSINGDLRDYATNSLYWHASNDGSGSGLDADLLDGNHASAFYLASNPSGYTTYSANQAVNTTSGPTFAEVYNNGWFRNNQTGEGMYNTTSGMHWYSNGGGNWTIRGGEGSMAIQFITENANTRGYVYADNANNIGFLTAAGGWRWRIDNSGVLQEGSVPWTRVTSAPAFVTSSGVTSVATGGGLTGGTITSTGTISHADTSTQGNVSVGAGSAITAISLDTYGHTTSISNTVLNYGNAPTYSVSGGTLTTSYNRFWWQRTDTGYYYTFTGYVTVSSSTGTATITLPISIYDGNVQATCVLTSSSGSGGDLVYASMGTSSLDSTFTITKDYATTTLGNAVFFRVTGYSLSALT